MNQLKIEQAKYKTAKKVSQDQSKPHINNKHTLHSEFIRLGITLLLVILIYKSTSSNQINYQEIIENQKMFVVKDVRGVFPPLNGTVLGLINKWKIIYFQTHKNSQWNKFENYSLQFGKEQLKVSKKGCPGTLHYVWYNFSFNINIVLKEKQSLIIQTSQDSNGNIECLNKQDIVAKMLNNASIWTLSSQFLYLLIQNGEGQASTQPQNLNQGDFYMILQRSSPSNV